MIEVTRLNKSKYYVNADMIEMIEETPDTILTLSSSKVLVVTESASEIIDRIIEYRRRIYANLPRQIERNSL